MEVAPTIKPVSPPSAAPQMITNASTGLTCGKAAKTDLPATVSAQRTAISTSSRACGL